MSFPNIYQNSACMYIHVKRMLTWKPLEKETCLGSLIPPSSFLLSLEWVTECLPWDISTLPNASREANFEVLRQISTRLQTLDLGFWSDQFIKCGFELYQLQLMNNAAERELHSHLACFLSIIVFSVNLTSSINGNVHKQKRPPDIHSFHDIQSKQILSTVMFSSLFPTQRTGSVVARMRNPVLYRNVWVTDLKKKGGWGWRRHEGKVIAHHIPLKVLGLWGVTEQQLGH